jgi:protein-L-isoaspartate O-methyltransferase
MLNSDINDQLASAADVKEGDFVLEIGPGTGSLTNVLINLGATVLAIEKVCLLYQFKHPLFCIAKWSILILQLHLLGSSYG